LSISLDSISKLVDGIRIGADRQIAAVSSLEDSGPTSLSLCVDNRYLTQLRNTKAAGVLLNRSAKPLLEIAPCSVILVDDPRKALAIVLEYFHPKPLLEPGIHPGAYVDASALVDEHARIEFGAYVASAAVVGCRTWIERGAFVGENVRIGSDCRIGVNVVIADGCSLGDRVLIEPCTVIGSKGFGFVKDLDAYHRIPQVGAVDIGNDVEIGAGCTIDRATLGVTRIGNGVKLDNQVHVGHNVVLGDNVVIAAQTGLSGSVTVEKGAMLGGQVGVADRVVIEAGAQVGSKAGVAVRVPAGVRVAGFPAVPVRKWLEEIRCLRRMGRVMKRCDKKGDSE
jgi:UDP-3-O-[3-hydroxymyristoyl] glucosamine N-acyltransferase